MLKKKFFVTIVLIGSLTVTFFYWQGEPDASIAQRLIVLFLGLAIGMLPYIILPRKRIIRYVDDHVMGPRQKYSKGLTLEGLGYGVLSLVVAGTAKSIPALFGILGMAFLSLAFGFLFFYVKFVEPERKKQANMTVGDQE